MGISSFRRMFPTGRTLGLSRREGKLTSARSSKGARRCSARRPPSPPRSPARRDALGRRAAEGVPDSQSASEQGGSAKREKPCEQGWRHLVVN